MTNEELVTKIQLLAYELITLVDEAEDRTVDEAGDRTKGLTEDEKDAIDEAVGNIHQMGRNL